MQFADFGGAQLLKEELARAEKLEEELTVNVNYLLHLVGINTAEREVGTHELRRVASSLFVALYERLFGMRLEGIIRHPTTKADYVVNAQRVIDSLSQQIKMDLQHITGPNIVDGNLQALSNLVHIFFHIVNITTGSQSSSDFRGPRDDRRRSGQDNSSDSLESMSTHESAFDEKGGMKKLSGPLNLKKMAASFRRNLEVPEENFQHIIAKEAEGILRSSEVMLAQQQRLEAARRRREDMLKSREIQFGDYNKRKEGVSYSAMQKRFLVDSNNEKKAFYLRRSNEEHVMLRKIYKGLLNKMHEWRVDKHEEMRSRVSSMREEARRHIQSLQALFEDRVRVLREQENDVRSEDSDVLKAQRILRADLQRIWAKKQNNAMTIKKSRVAQVRDRELLLRKEAHKNLLSLLATEEWTDSLRQSEIQSMVF
jgi:hypothetical protein